MNTNTSFLEQKQMSTFIFAQNRYQLNIELAKLSVAASWLRSKGCKFQSNVKGATATLTFSQMPKQVAAAIAAKHGLVNKQVKQNQQISREQYQTKFAHSRRNYPKVKQISREQWLARQAKVEASKRPVASKRPTVTPETKIPAAPKQDLNRNNCDRRSGGSTNNLSKPQWKTETVGLDHESLDHKKVTVHALKRTLFDHGVDEVAGYNLSRWSKDRTMINKQLLIEKCQELGITEISFKTL